VIGRSRSCDLVLRDDSVSRRHLMLTVDGDHVLVTDLGSTNGTLLNGRWITEAEARPGDVLQLGEIELVL
jgi:pSer/pThr/pTyr-binding forkhead associated (FHA) protein